MVQFTTDLNSPQMQEALVEENMHHQINTRPIKICQGLSWGFAALFLLLTVIRLVKYWSISIVSLLYAALFLAVGFLIKPLFRKRIRKLVSRQNADDVAEYTVDDSGIISQGKNSRTEISWGAVINTAEQGDFLKLYLQNNKIIFCDKTRLPAEKVQELRELVRTHMGEKTEPAVPAAQTEEKPEE